MDIQIFLMTCPLASVLVYLFLTKTELNCWLKEKAEYQIKNICINSYS